MTTIAKKFSELKEKGERALIGFIMVGDPDAELSIEIANALIKGGVDILELGLPFSDPIADGPRIQKASERALSKGMNPDLYFKTVKKISSVVPKVCLSYYNLIFRRGLERFVKDCKLAGISGIIVPDLPPEEAEPLLRACKSNDVDLIFLVSPVTSATRIKEISAISSGFIYVVSLLGVTGEREKLSKELAEVVSRVKANTSLPVCVGFGVSKPEHVREILAMGADGVIVGSAFIRIIEENLENKEIMLEKIEQFARSLKSGTLAANGQ